MKRMPAWIFALTLVLMGLGLPATSSAQQVRAGQSLPRCRHCGRPLVGLSLTSEPLFFHRPYASRRANACQCPPAAVAPQAAVDGAAQPLPPGQPEPGSPEANNAPMPSLPAGADSGATGLASNAASFAGLSMGDLSPIARISAKAPPVVTPPVPPGAGGGIRPPISPALALVRGFKIADNQTPIPIDRYFFTYNYFDYVNQSVVDRFQIPVKRIQAYRAMLGFETTFWDKTASIGVRLPINTLTADGVYPSTPTTTALGDLSLYSKHILWRDDERRALVSGGLAVVIPTGPRTFANSQFIQAFHNFEIQPYLGYQKVWGKLFLIGFEAINVPTAVHDVTFLYNDFALGYLVYEANQKDQLVRSVTTNLECHVNIPLNHRDVFNSQDVVGSADVVDFTYGVNFKLGSNTLASFGVVTPVTGPRPFSLEALAILNIFAF